MSRAELLVLRAGDEKVLREWTRASSIPAGLAQRARILLLAAQGHSNTEIGRLVGVSLPTVRLWRGRYGAGGVEGLGDLHRSGRPAIHDETSIIAVTLEPPPDTLGVTHWSVRLLADHLDISFAGVRHRTHLRLLLLAAPRLLPQQLRHRHPCRRLPTVRHWLPHTKRNRRQAPRRRLKSWPNSETCSLRPPKLLRQTGRPMLPSCSPPWQR